MKTEFTNKKLNIRRFVHITKIIGNKTRKVFRKVLFDKDFSDLDLSKLENEKVKYLEKHGITKDSYNDELDYILTHYDEYLELLKNNG